MGCTQDIARVNEAWPLGLAWTNRAVGHRVVAYREPWPNGRQHSCEFETLPCRPVSLPIRFDAPSHEGASFARLKTWEEWQPVAVETQG